MEFFTMSKKDADFDLYERFGRSNSLCFARVPLTVALAIRFEVVQLFPSFNSVSSTRSYCRLRIGVHSGRCTWPSLVPHEAGVFFLPGIFL